MNWDEIQRECRAVNDYVLATLREQVLTSAEEVAGRLQAGGKVLVCGNGGSAADAQHLAAELVNRFLLDRRPYAGIALTTDGSVLSSVGNDYGFDQVFEKQVRALGRAGDVLVAISTSGNAENVCRAVRAAKDLDLHTIGLTGGSGGTLAGLVDTTFCIACTSHVPRIQEGHELIVHLLCERLEEILL